MRTAYTVRAHPEAEQAAMADRTFGCVRVVWNRTLAGRSARQATTALSTSYRESDAALTVMKRDPDLTWLSEVSSVPLQQTLRHQHAGFSARSSPSAGGTPGSRPATARRPRRTPGRRSLGAMAT
jgi:putative transposase